MHADDFTLKLQGADGVVWALHGPQSYRSPVRLEEGAIGELYDVPIVTSYRARVGQPGADYQGHRVLSRHLQLRLVFHANDWWVDESKLRRSLRADKDAILIVQSTVSGERRLRVRLEETPEYGEALSPFAVGVFRKTYSLIAPDPYWYAPESFTVDWVFNGSNWAGDTITVTNAGDVPAWPKWVLTAPAKFGLPDIPVGEAHDQQRFVYLPFQKIGREVVVDSDPMKEMVVSNDDSLIWAQMNGQFFQNPIPGLTFDASLPMYVDPFPLLPFQLPNEWRLWIAENMRDLVQRIGLDAFLAWNPRRVGNQIETWIKGARPDWVPEIPADWIAEMTGAMLATAIEQTWGRVSNIAGASAQLRLDWRWEHPWL